MGGIGKTELALQYTKSQMKGNQYPAGICWLTARDQNIATQIIDFAQIHLNLKLPQQLKDDARITFCWKHWPQGVALIVIDDVTNYDAIKPYLPEDSRFKVLITTRLDLGSSFKKVAIEELDSKSAIALLESFPGAEGRIRSQMDDTQALCKWVGYLPLALELLGRFLARKLDWSIDRLIKELEVKRLDANALVKRENGMTGQLGVAAALELSWQELNEAERELACVLGMFAIAPIPWSLVESCQPEVDPEDLEDIRDDGLMAHSLLKRVGDGSYQLHQIVQEYFRIKLSEKGDQGQSIKANFWQGMVGIAKTINQSMTIMQIEQIRESIAHLEEGVRSWVNSIIDIDLIWPFVAIGHFYQSQGSYSSSESWQKDCVEMTRKRLGNDHPDIATSLNNLAGLYRLQGKYQEAEPLLCSALEVTKRLLGEKHIDTATSLNNLAQLYCSQGKYGEAESLLCSALEIRKNVLGEEHLDVAQSLNNLGGLYRLQGKYEKAESLLFSALEMRKNVLGEEHLDVAQSLNNFGGLYRLQGKYEEAEPLLCSALEVNKRLLGEEHPDVVTNMNNLGLLYHFQRKYGKAEPLLSSALEINTRILGENHPSVAMSQNNLASLYCSQGKYMDAESLVCLALNKKVHVLGENHPSVARSQANLGNIYQKMGRYPEAEALYRKALEIAQSKLGSNHPDTRCFLNLLNSLPQPPA
jgi:tetratricopeptide (TPR) repeat protein